MRFLSPLRRRTVRTNPIAIGLLVLWLLDAGSVVQIHGGPYATGRAGRISIVAKGTRAKPVSITGGASASRPELRPKMHIQHSTYLIIEHLLLRTKSGAIGIRPTRPLEPVHHISVRHLEVDGMGVYRSNQAMGATSKSPNSPISNVVFYSNYSHDIGDLEATRGGRQDDSNSFSILRDVARTRRAGYDLTHPITPRPATRAARNIYFPLIDSPRIARAGHRLSLFSYTNQTRQVPFTSTHLASRRYCPCWPAGHLRETFCPDCGPQSGRRKVNWACGQQSAAVSKRCTAYRLHRICSAPCAGNLQPLARWRRTADHLQQTPDGRQSRKLCR